jgi:hypothetical protein
MVESSEYQRDTLSRLSHQDELMLESPHASPVKKVREVFECARSKIRLILVLQHRQNLAFWLICGKHTMCDSAHATADFLKHRYCMSIFDWLNYLNDGSFFCFSSCPSHSHSTRAVRIPEELPGNVTRKTFAYIVLKRFKPESRVDNYSLHASIYL